MNRLNLLTKLKQYKELNEKKYGILTMGVFGSFARDQASVSSDVDIVVETKTPDPFAIVHIKEDLEDELHMPIDIVRLRDQMNSFLKDRIEKEAVYV